MTNEQLEAAILSDVVKRFVNLNASTSRRDLLIKFRNLPTSQVIGELLNRNILRRKTSNVATTEEEYLPSAAAFEFCGDTQLRDQARLGTTVVLHALQQMFVAEQKKEGFVFKDLKTHVALTYPSRIFDDATLKLGLYLSRDFNALASYRLNLPEDTEVVSFQVAEGAISMANPDREWDRIMTAWRPTPALQDNDSESKARRLGAIQHRTETSQWEEIKPLGSGGQSDVFLVRSPRRVAERVGCLTTIRRALDGDKRAELAEAIWCYARPEVGSELGAIKRFKIPTESTMPPSGTKDHEAIKRLENEVSVLRENRPGLPRLLDSNIKERWIVTEYFPEGSLERHPEKFKGNVAYALKAFQSLVETVASLHQDGYVHRDIKLPNVFVGANGQLVLGDFGIVYVPDALARITLTGERVGPRDYMPQWAHLGVRQDTVEPCTDVYMLGKLLWSMVDGRIFLPREYHHRQQFDLTQTYPNNPEMFLINKLIDFCVVEDSGKCLHSAGELLLMVNDALAMMTRGGQLLTPEVPRPCRICGKGRYERVLLDPHVPEEPVVNLSLAGKPIQFEVWVCNQCYHSELFRAG